MWWSIVEALSRLKVSNDRPLFPLMRSIKWESRDDTYVKFLTPADKHNPINRVSNVTHGGSVNSEKITFSTCRAAIVGHRARVGPTSKNMSVVALINNE